MSEQVHWRHAVIISICVHCMLLVGAGWLASGIFGKAAEPEIIEMELVSSVVIPEQAAPVPVSMPQSAEAAAKNTPVNHAQPITANPMPAISATAGAVVADSYNPAATAPAGSGSAEAVAPASTGTAAAVSAAPKRIAAPRVLSKVEPDYPEDARQDNYSGIVGVKVEVLENGYPGEVRVARSSGRRSLDEAAVQAVRQWRFVPAQESGSGQAVRCLTTFSIVFELS